MNNTIKNEMNKVQKVINPETKICEAKGCERLIQVGELAVKQYRMKPLKPKWYHINCRKYKTSFRRRN